MNATGADTNESRHILGATGSPALLIWMVLGLIAAVAIGIIVAIVKDDRKETKKADLEAGGARQRKMENHESVRI